MELRIGQQSVLDGILAAYKSGEKKVALSGDPGTGKTFTTGSIVSAFRNMGRTVAVVTSDNKALVVSKRHAMNSGWFHKVSYWGTVFQLMGLVLNPKISSLEPKGRDKSALYDVVIVDEASKLNSNIVYQLEKCAKFVLYVGDRNQLLPIGEDSSPAFSGTQTFELTENVRQNGNQAIVDLFTYIKRAIHENLYDIPAALIAPFRYTDRFKWEAELNEESMVISGTNAEAERVNRLIRAKAGRTDQYNEGDRIIFTETYSVKEAIEGRRQQLFAASETAVVEDANRGISNGVFPVWHLRCRGMSGESHNIVVPNTEYDFNEDRDNGQWWRYQVTEMGRKAPQVASVKYAYAITDWRSQGDEFPMVGVNLHDFRRFRDVDTRRRMLLVAASRATERLAIYAKD